MQRIKIEIIKTGQVFFRYTNMKKIGVKLPIFAKDMLIIDYIDATIINNPVVKKGKIYTLEG